MDAAAVQQGVNDSAFFSSVGVANEHPVLRADFGGTELGLEQVGVQSGVSVLEAFSQCRPILCGIAHCFAELAPGDRHVRGVGVQMSFDLFGDRLGFFGPQDFPRRVGDCVLVPGFLEVVEVGDRPGACIAQKYPCPPPGLLPLMYLMKVSSI